ncbi:MAG: PQQ-dependent sugar dehydrogenase, partial [Actinomycetota bacterium]
MRRASASLLLVATFIIGVAAPTDATAVVDPTARLTKVTTVAKPTDIASRASDTGLYIAEQDGRVVRFDTKTKAKSTALDLTGRTGASGERGLLGLVFHPNGRFLCVNYTDDDGNTVVARYRMRADNTADPTSRTVLFTLDQPYANHNGGGLAFGPGRRLYIGTGDGGSRDDPQRVALDRSSMLGKIISVDPLARNAKSAAARIWSVGLRNPWRFEFDDVMNLWVADVGQDKWEEVSLARASAGSGRREFRLERLRRFRALPQRPNREEPPRSGSRLRTRRRRLFDFRRHKGSLDETSRSCGLVRLWRLLQWPHHRHQGCRPKGNARRAPR